MKTVDRIKVGYSPNVPADLVKKIEELLTNLFEAHAEESWGIIVDIVRDNLIAAFDEISVVGIAIYRGELFDDDPGFVLDVALDVRE
jgi:hypothetical protein